MKTKSEEQYAEQFLRDHGWRLIKGYKLDHSMVEHEFETSYWNTLEALIVPVKYWECDKYPKQCFEDPWAAVEHTEKYRDVDFTKWRKENHDMIFEEEHRVH